MNIFASTGLGLGLTMQMCGDASSSYTPTSTGFSCSDYDIMLDVEVKIAQDSTTEEELYVALLVTSRVAAPTSTGLWVEVVVATGQADLAAIGVVAVPVDVLAPL